jgi:cytochrome c peroxidase
MLQRRNSVLGEWRSMLWVGLLAAGGLCCGSLMKDCGGIAQAARGGGGDDGSGSGSSGRLAALSTVPVPQPTRVDYIDKAAVQRLGKALFWDVQAGGDGQTACATCHATAGADARTFNTINPGADGRFDVVAGPGAPFVLSDFSPRFDDIVGSQGVVASTFQSIAADPSVAVDVCIPDSSNSFSPNRQVTGLQAPSAIGAVFNRFNFWNGRANPIFNRLDPFGATGNASVPLAYSDMSSLASQAVGPAGSSVEMACAGRPLNGANSLGAKLLARPALQFQVVHPTDSLLGSMSAYPNPGLNCGNHACTYQELVDLAYGPGDSLNQFSAYWGEAVQAYESLLVPDATPLDHFLAGDVTQLTQSQQRGLSVFQGKGQCTKCHAGPELTDASVSFFLANGAVNEDGGDQGFHNNGVRPTAENLGRAGVGPQGISLSVSGAAADRGAFKTSGLRNVGLTAPYFHNGGKATLAEVVDFYDRGGDFANAEKARRVRVLGLSAQEKAALVDFLQNALTDCRVANQRGPFDHPSIDLPNGAHLAAVGAEGTGACR